MEYGKLFHEYVVFSRAEGEIQLSSGITSPYVIYSILDILTIDNLRDLDKEIRILNDKKYIKNYVHAY